jgi:hypothetical protein
MANKYLRKFLTPAAATETTIYTVPAAIKTVIRHIHISNPSGSAVTLTLSIGADAAATRIFDAYSIAANTVLDHFCYYALVAAEVLQAAAGTNNILTITVDGGKMTLNGRNARTLYRVLANHFGANISD